MAKLLLIIFKLILEIENLKFPLRVTLRVKPFIFQLRVSYSKLTFLFFNFELITRKWKNKSLTLELVTGSET